MTNKQLTWYERVGERVGAWFQVAKKAAQRAFILTPDYGRGKLFDASYASLVANGLKGNAAVAACVTELAFSFPKAPLIAYRDVGKGELERVESTHPLARLMAQPHPELGEAEFKQLVIMFASIGGAAYIWKQREGNTVVALWPFSKGDIRPVPSKSTETGIIARYELVIDSDRPVAIPREDIIQIRWLPDPYEPAKSIGAIELAISEIAADSAVSRHIRTHISNHAIPPVVITLPEGEMLDDDISTRVRASWMSRYGGANAGGIGILEAGMTATAVGNTMEQLRIEYLRDVPEARIAAAFRVPAILAGLTVGLNRSTFSNYGEARQAFVENTIMPLWRLYGNEFQAELVKEFDQTGVLRLEHDLSDIPELRVYRIEQEAAAVAAFNSNIMRRSEARRAMGLPVDAGDEVYASQLMGATAPMPTAAPATNDQPADDAPKSAMLEMEKKALQQGYVDARRKVRTDVERRMVTAVDAYFEELGTRMVGRIYKTGQPRGETKADGARPLSEFSDDELRRLVDDLLTAKDGADLEAVFSRYYLEITGETWSYLNLELGIYAPFDRNDPLVLDILESAGQNIRDITATTRESVAKVLQTGYEAGWSIDDLVAGRDGFSGLRSFVTETYSNRAKAIARTELGMAQNMATNSRYASAGVQNVRVFDNGFPNSHPNCKKYNNTVQTLAWAKANPLEHPNCVRAFAAEL